LNTFYLSLRNIDNTGWASTACKAGETCWGIFENYHYALTSSIMQTAFLNNIKWILLMVTGTVALGLLIAVLADRVRYESVAKSIIFLPMAIPSSEQV
jgi:alpha-glucoside transport system permease protein